MSLHIDLLTCPLCNESFVMEWKSVRCSKGHCFDIAKEGYLNLLPVQSKNSKDPGDSKEMIQSRRAFLEKGYYDPLVEYLQLQIKKYSGRLKSVLDIGCGEGFYTDRLLTRFENVIGLDIAKNAIRSASKKYKNPSFVVGSIYDIPVRSGGIDLALSIFTPIDSEQIRSVLSANGTLIVVSSGADHMMEIAKYIYDEFTPHTYAPESRLVDHFKLIAKSDCTFKVKLENKDAALNMVKMTPYYWSMTQQQVELNSIPLSVTADFKISIFTPRLS